MPEEQNEKEPSSLDAKDIIAAVRELNICLKSVNIYPAEHDQVKASVQRSRQALGTIFNFMPDLTLAVTGNSLMVGSEYLAPDNPVCRDFARSLKSHDIAAITFYKEIDRDELTRLLLLVNEKPDDILDRGGMASAFESDHFQNVKIKTVDYSKLSLTEEKEISRRKKEDGSKGSHRPQENVWKDFVSHLVADTLADDDGGISADELGDIDPAELARFINENRGHTETALQSYHHLLDRHFTETGPGSPPAAGASPETADRGMGKSGLSYDLGNWNRLLEELNPEVRKQFLSVSFDHLESKSRPQRTEEFLGSMSGGLIIDMLRTANQDGKGISPSLLSLIRKLSAAQEDGFRTADDRSAVFKQPDGRGGPTEDNLQILFDREKHEDYVVEDYDGVLKKLTAESTGEPLAENTGFSVEDHLATLEDQHLNSRIAQILIGFMNGNIDRTDYKAYADKLIRIGEESLNPPDFQLLLLILKTFSTHMKKKTDDEIKKTAKVSVAALRKPEFTSKAVQAFFKDGELSDQDGFHFLTALGPGIMPDVVKFYAGQDKPDMPGLLSGIITHYRKEALLEAQKRLSDTRTLFVRNLIVMLRVLNAREAEGRVKQLLEHDNTDIRMEALETLLHFKNQWALPVLKQLVRSNEGNVSSTAIFLCGKYKVEDMAVILTSMLKTFIIFKPDIKKNMELTSALGKIADPHTIPVLEKLIARTPLLYAKETAKMKLAAYESLAGYDYTDAEKLLKKGSASKNSEMATVCKKIINQKQGDRSP